MRTLGLTVLAAAALALAVVTTLSAREEMRIVTMGTRSAKPSQELAVVGGEQQTTELKAVWRPLRNQEPGFYPDRSYDKYKSYDIVACGLILCNAAEYKAT